MEDLHRQREENGRIQREGEEAEAEEIEPFSASHTPVEIWTVGERELERFLQNLEDGYQLDPEAFARREEAILIVPGITGTKVEGGWRYGTSMNPINWERSEKEGFPVCVEELARVGDVLTVSYRDISQEQVKIAAFSNVWKKITVIPFHRLILPMLF